LYICMYHQKCCDVIIEAKNPHAMVPHKAADHFTSVPLLQLMAAISSSETRSKGLELERGIGPQSRLKHSHILSLKSLHFGESQGLGH